MKNYDRWARTRKNGSFPYINPAFLPFLEAIWRENAAKECSDFKE